MLLLAVAAVDQPPLPVPVHAVGAGRDPWTPLTLKKSKETLDHLAVNASTATPYSDRT